MIRWSRKAEIEKTSKFLKPIVDYYIKIIIKRSVFFNNDERF